MSYDLSFLRPAGHPGPSLPELKSHFSARPRYTIRDSQFWYQNDDTGVYFSFDYSSDPPDLDIDPEDQFEPPDDGLEATGLSFNINYFRPHFFGLEAEPELASLVRSFRLLIDDPQNDGMGRGAYSREGFLRGWNAGNLFGHRAFLHSQSEGQQLIGEVATLPASVLDRHWAWNYQRDELLAEINEDIYVSLVRLARRGDSIISFAVWGDAIPQAIPQVDYLVLVRKDLAPRRFLRPKAQDICLVPFTDLGHVSSVAQKRSSPVEYLLFDHSGVPPVLAAFFRSQQPMAEKLNGLSWDSVLTAEVLEEAQLQHRRRDA